jgi:hypothetical protein
MTLRKINGKLYPDTDIDWDVLTILKMTAPLEMPDIKQILRLLPRGIRLEVLYE